MVRIPNEAILNINVQHLIQKWRTREEEGQLRSRWPEAEEEEAEGSVKEQGSALWRRGRSVPGRSGFARGA